MMRPVAQWQAGIKRLAGCPNVMVKIGGLAMPVNGFGWGENERPPSSDEVAAAQNPMRRRAFGYERTRGLAGAAPSSCRPNLASLALFYHHEHFATRGGVSKASKEINASEDISSGYKTVLAGGCVVFRVLLRPWLRRAIFSADHANAVHVARARCAEAQARAASREFPARGGGGRLGYT